ncbi:histidine ammonia-lyase [Proteiniborus sp. MB09-C3]|uniref:histidine ammonia-lyase n=1 Tax=Proteiniborus sp. MB09-C3 TaxID=3050072 RepID=UPI0025576F51|nr:histidine ammonia-lyase [Proteiniborus sp. MB09-C3]WIV10501.1 histidine ammonia-lyase [Proteiniborus sp. MB09-C3]
MGKVVIDGNSLKIEDVVNVCRNNYQVELSANAMDNVVKSREVVEQYVNNEKVVYGITTGFGKFSDVVISKDEAKTLQRNLIISHSCGVGEPLDEEIVRGVMLLRANALAKGYSGIRLETLNILIEMVNKGVHPVIPEKGSLGSSGDLAPLSHIVLVMLGEGEAFYNGARMSGKKAMELANIPTIELTSKEGLALINGTQVMTAIGALTVYDAMNLSKMSDIIAGLTVEALCGIVTAFDENVHRVRPHQGQINTARNLLRVLQDSNMTTEQGEIRVQDAYVLRCLPQIHGASKDAIEYVKEKVEIEINSATDNPLIFRHEDKVISGGNFHGQPMALSFDFLGIALAELANVSERRLERLVNPALSELPAFLVEKGGLNSGFMIVQYSAASLVSENKVLSHPASVDSIPSSANQEDHVSMGTIAARKARNILDNARKVLSMEILAACQAIDLRGNKGLGKGTLVAYELVRKEVSKLEDDRVMYIDINKCESLLKSNIIIEKVEESIGELN